MPKMKAFKLIWDKYKEKVFRLFWDRGSSEFGLLVIVGGFSLIERVFYIKSCVPIHIIYLLFYIKFIVLCMLDIILYNVRVKIMNNSYLKTTHRVKSIKIA